MGRDGNRVKKLFFRVIKFQKGSTRNLKVNLKKNGDEI